MFIIIFGIVIFVGWGGHVTHVEVVEKVFMEKKEKFVP